MKSNLLQQSLQLVKQFFMGLFNVPARSVSTATMPASAVPQSQSRTTAPEPKPESQKSAIAALADEIGEAETPASANDQKSACRKAYLEKGGQWDYERWGKTYSDNMKRALQANIAVNQYHHEIGWGLKEVSIRIDGKKETLSIADIDAMRGIEVSQAKYATRSKAAMKKIARHEALVKKGWDITWKIAGTASLPLLKELKRAGINITY